MKQISVDRELLRRFIVILASAVWFGGFTFYSGVVIHTGHQVYGSHREVGFLTQQVTTWLNLIGVLTLLVLLWNLLAAWRDAAPAIRRGLLLTWVVMAGIEIALFMLHPRLDGTLDETARVIRQRAIFRGLHLWYMNLSTGQWVANILHFWFVLSAWRRQDRAASTAAPLAAGA